MAKKMFYTVEEAAKRLGISTDEVIGMTESGQLQEFRDQDRVMLKVDQVDLLAGGDEDDEMIPLAEGDDEIGLADTGGGGFSLEPEGEAEDEGISIFDPEGEEEADPSAATQVSGAVGMGAAQDFMSDAGSSGSGSGLANLALESDDTSLGADLLEDVYGSDESGSQAPAMVDSGTSTGALAGGAGDSLLGGSQIVDAGADLFEPAGGEADPTGGPAPAMPAAAEIYDGAGSGLVGGAAVGIVLLLLATLTVFILAASGNTAILDGFNMNVVYGVAGGGLGAVLIGAAIGWALLRRT